MPSGNDADLGRRDAPAACDRPRRQALASGVRVAALGVALAALQLAGCARPPAARKDLLEFLHDGSTTREQVELALGEPSARFEHSRVLAYRLKKDQAGYVLLPRRDNWASVQYDLMLLFDASGVLQRHSLVEVRSP